MKINKPIPNEFRNRVKESISHVLYNGFLDGGLEDVDSLDVIEIIMQLEIDFDIIINIEDEKKFVNLNNSILSNFNNVVKLVYNKVNESK